jgi:hypothetical protein
MGTASSTRATVARLLSRCLRRCSTTAAKTACKCSGMTESRPSIRAQARAARSSPMAARGDNPMLKVAALRVWATRLARSRAGRAIHAPRARRAAGPQGLDAHRGFERVHQIAAIGAAQEFALGGRIRIAQMHAHQEAVQLRLGQRKGADLILGVLRGDDEEGLGQGHRLAIEGHLMLFHGLEQRALGFGRGAVDFIGQHQLRERSDRAESGTCRFPDRKSTRPARRRAGGRW